MAKERTIVIIGGGAAGFFCAANIKADSDTRIIILERSQKCLSKVKISGGGRCNVTHFSDSISDMAKKYPRGNKLVKKTFHQFFTSDTVSWFAARGLRLKAEADNRMFPITDDSQSVIDVLEKAVFENGVEVKLGQHVHNILPVEDGFLLSIKGQAELHAHQLVIACGGFPKLCQFEWLQNLGHSIVSPVPSLFSFNIPRHPITELMGLSVPNAKVKVNGTKLQQSGPLLITHWGLSGPAILKLSAYGALELAEKEYKFQLQVNFLAEHNEDTLKEFFAVYKQQHPTQKISNIQGFPIPKRLWDLLLFLSQIDEEQRWLDVPAKQMNKLLKSVTALELNVTGKTTFKDEFVTAGGVSLTEIDSATLESKLQRNLYFAGEIMDVDGITGGFNFQHAWTSGFIVGKRLSEDIEF